MSYTPEEFLNEHCKNEDWDRLNECLKDSMMTNNVIEYMQLYSDMKTNQFADEIQAIRYAVTKWHEEAKRLAEQNFQLRSDKARLVEALKELMSICEIHGNQASWNFASAEMECAQELLTEMEQK